MVGAGAIQDDRAQLVTDLGEYRVHGLLEELLNGDGARTVGDDCAVYDMGGGKALLLNIDKLASNVESYNRARLCVAQTLSDIICMGGDPESFLVSLTLPRDTTVEALKSLTTGLQNELARYDTRLIGGDTKEGPAFHMVGFAMGQVRSECMVRRTGAAAGMLVGVTSTAGRQWGMRWANAIIRELRLSVPASLTELCAEADHVINLPRAESRAAIGTGHVRAGLDLSDGIGGGLRILSHASNVRIAVDRPALAGLIDSRLAPVADALELPLEALALSPGYNWENMYVVEEAGAAEVARAVDSAGGLFSVIGRVESGRGIEIGGVEIERSRVPADEKFAKEYSWENRFLAWRQNCRDLLLGSDG